MALFRRQQKPLRSITAASQALQTPTQSNVRRGGAAWQREAWDYYDQVGELHYAAGFFSSCMRRLNLRIAVKDRQGRISTAWDEDGNPVHPQVPQATEILDLLHPTIGGQGELLALAACNLAVAGEAFLVGQNDDQDWNILSSEELGVEGGKYVYIDEKGQKSPLQSEYDPIRIWKAHPRRSSLADSSVHPLLDVLEELVLLTRGIRAIAVSRLANAGIFYIPNEIELPTPPGQEESNEDQLVIDLITHFTTPIRDKSSAAATVPFVMRGPGDQKANIGKWDFIRDFDGFPSIEIRKEAISRLAQGFDLPLEIVTGTSGVNHWGAWQIDESTFKAHIEPMAEIIVDGLTDWLEMLLGGRPVNNGLEVVVHYDATELVSHPNEGANANDAFDRFTISAARYREAKGFSEHDAPSEDEVAGRLEIERVKRSPSGTNPVQAEDVEQGPPAQTASIEVAVERAVERFGARLRSKLNGRTATRSQLDGVPNQAAARHLGPQSVREIMGDEELFPGEFNALARVLQRQGLSASEAQALASQAEALAGRRLFDPEATL